MSLVASRSSRVNLSGLADVLAATENRAHATLVDSQATDFKARASTNSLDKIGFVRIHSNRRVMLASLADKTVQNFAVISPGSAWCRGETVQPFSVCGISSTSKEMFCWWEGALKLIVLPQGLLTAHLLEVGADKAQEVVANVNQVVVNPTTYATFCRLHQYGVAGRLRDANQILDFLTIALLQGNAAPQQMPTRNWDLIFQLVAAVQDDAGGSPMSVKQIAKSLFISGSCLTTACRNCFGCSPGKLHEAVRISQAHYALTQTHHTVKTVMKRFGFNHAGRFSAKYKSVFGHPPSASLPLFRLSTDPFLRIEPREF